MNFAVKPRSPFEDALAQAFAARSRVNETQGAAFDRFAKLGLPHRKVEGWKWSDFRAALRDGSFEPDAASDTAAIPPSPFAELDPLEIRIVDGRIIVADEPHEGLRFGVMDPVGTIEELETHPLAALNVAMTRKALGLEAVEGADVERPVLIRHIATREGFAFSQSLTRVDRGARLRVIETFEGLGAGFSSHLGHGVVRDGGVLERIVVDEAGAARRHAIAAIKMEEGARFDQASLSAGGALSRHETIVHFWGEGASTRIDSAALLGGDRHADFTTHVLHKAPNCAARQLHKGVAADRARAVFQGKFEVEQAAQKTDAQMTANALLLSEGAEANHKPELEIYADDVECAHGSTAGALDADALFYLRQRGVPEPEARALLIEAFVGEIIDRAPVDLAKDILAATLRRWLEAL